MSLTIPEGYSVRAATPVDAPIIAVQRGQMFVEMGGMTPQEAGAQRGLWTDWLAQALAAGDVAALQIRLKPADEATIRHAVAVLAPVARRHEVAVILNDRPDLAVACGADGLSSAWAFAISAHTSAMSSPADGCAE